MPMPTTVNGRPVKTGSWTPQEDKLLADWQAKLGNRWSAVAKKISGRTGQQCAQRWRHKVNPHIKKEKWTDDEDDRLAMLVRQFGSAWAEIARRMRGRTDQQCMGRWRRHLDPSIRREAWSTNEDALLVRMFQEYGSQWSRISKAVAGRTAQQCRARWFQLQPNDGAAEGRMLPPGRSSGRRTSRRAQNDDFDDDEDDDDLGEEYDDDEEFADEEGEGSGAGGEEGRSSRLVAIIEGMDGAFDDQGRSHHILPLASPRGPNRMYAPRDRVNGFRTTQMGRRPVPSGVIGRLPPASEYRAEPKLGGEPATPMPHSLSPPRTLPNRSQSSRQKGHSSSNRPGGLPGPHNRMSDSWVSSNTVMRKPGHQSGQYNTAPAFPWISGNPNGDDTSAPPTPAGRSLEQRGGNPPDELSPPAMLGSPLSRQTGRRAEAQLLNGQTSPLPWRASAAPSGERLFASPSPRKRSAPGGLPIGTSPLRPGSRPLPSFPDLPLNEASKPRIGPHNGFNTPGNITLGPAAATATPPKDSSAQPPRVPNGQSSPQASHSSLPNGFNSPTEASAAPQEGSSQETDAADGTQPMTSSGGASDRISPIFGGPRPSPGQYWRSSPTNSVLSLLRSPTGGPAYKADLLASPDFSTLVQSPGSAEKLAAATAAGIPLPKALANLASQQGLLRPPTTATQDADHPAKDADENSAGSAAWCNRKVVRKLINAAPGHGTVAALAAQHGSKAEGNSSDVGAESPTKKSRSGTLVIQPLQTHQPSRLQGSSSIMRPRSEQARQRLLAMMDTI